MIELATIEAHMPTPAPLAMPQQDLQRHTPVYAEPTSWRTLGCRVAVFVPAVITTSLLLSAFVEWLSGGGLTALEMLLIGLVGLTFAWISLYVSSATLGFLAHFKLLHRNPVALQPQTELSTALLMPIYAEDPAMVFGNAAAMAHDLATQKTAHQFEFYFLSDTRDQAIADQELRAFELLRTHLPKGMSAWYRRRPHNIDKKSGNIADWLTRWGARHDAMLVLDADSLMSASAMIALTNALAADPNAGLIQSQPALYAGQSLFGRMQQFAGDTYGFLLAKGLSLWTGKESNFWGHNAIMRTRAFADCAGLPKIRGLRSRTSLILSHDIVEAALLRRAGWSVRFLPEIKGSFEEAPPSLIDFCLRDRRWCMGNMQHLRVMWARGLHWVSRFHMLNGAMGYLLSPVWFALLTIWILLGRGEDANPISYFSAQNPLYPHWPQQSMVNSFWLLLFMYAMLITPKVMGLITTAITPGAISKFGGVSRFALSFLSELVTSVLYAPLLMIQQTIAVARALVGVQAKWEPQQRKSGRYSSVTLLKFHALETVLGMSLAVGMGLGIVSLWLLPIMVSLICAVPLSAISGLRLHGHAIMGTPGELAPSEIIKSATLWRTLFEDLHQNTPSTTARAVRRSAAKIALKQPVSS